MINWLLKRIIGSKNQRDLKRMRPLVDRINQIEQEYQSLGDDQLRARTAEWKARLAPVEDPEERAKILDEILPEAFAAVKNAARRLVGQHMSVCDHDEVWTNEYWICPAKLADTGGDLRDLLIRVRPRISDVWNKLVYRNQTDLQIPQTAKRVTYHEDSSNRALL